MTYKIMPNGIQWRYVLLKEKMIVKRGLIKIFEGVFTDFVENTEKGRHFRLLNQKTDETLDVYTIELSPFDIRYYKIEVDSTGIPLEIPITIEKLNNP
jgi:hypothetical protein